MEFARSSGERAGAPTLVPVPTGGANVRAKIRVLKTSVPEDDAKDRLWRRETNQVGSGEHYRHTESPGPNTVVIKVCESFHGVKRVLYTEIAPNLENPSVQTLADLARQSVRAVAQGRIEKGRDGISYLAQAVANGIVTPLSGPYAEEVKLRAQAKSLEEALDKTLSYWRDQG